MTSEIIANYPGHILTGSRAAGEERNSYRLMKIKNDVEVYYEMQVSSGEWFKFDILNLPKILNYMADNLIIRSPTWFLYLNKIVTNIESDRIYLGKYLFNTEHFAFKNQDFLDFREKNIQILTEEEINQKQASSRRTKELPDELKNVILPKYVYFSEETTSGGTRQYFRIEKHPNLEKTWSSTKSSKYTILEKLEQTKQKLKEIDGNAEEDSHLQILGKPTIKLPKYVQATYDNNNNPIRLVYDRKLNGMRQSIRMKYNNSKTLEDNISDLMQQFNEKYSE